MARLSTCKCCEEKLTSEEKFTYSGKTYCKKCYDKLIKEKEQRDELISMLCENMNIDSPTGLMLKQIKDYHETCSYTYGGMTYTTWYYIEILNKTLNVKYGLAFIKYYYEEAKKYCEHQLEIEKSVKDIKEDYKVKTKTITINTNKKPKKLLLDLNKLVEEKVNEL